MPHHSTLAVLASLVLLLHAAAPVRALFNETFVPVDGQVQLMPGLWDKSYKGVGFELIDSGRGADDVGAMRLYSEGTADTDTLVWDGSESPVSFYYKGDCESSYDSDMTFKVQISANDGTNWTTVYSKTGKELDPAYGAWTRVTVAPQPVMKDTPDPNNSDGFSHQFAVRFSFKEGYSCRIFIDDLEFPADLPPEALQQGPPYVPVNYKQGQFTTDSSHPVSTSETPASPAPSLTPGQQAGAAIGVVGGVTLATSIGLAIANQLFGVKIMCCRNAKVSLFGDKEKDPDQAGKPSQPGKTSNPMGKLFGAQNGGVLASNARASSGVQNVHASVSGSGPTTALQGSGTGPGLSTSGTSPDNMV